MIHSLKAKNSTFIVELRIKIGGGKRKNNNTNLITTIYTVVTERMPDNLETSAVAGVVAPLPLRFVTICIFGSCGVVAPVIAFVAPAAVAAAAAVGMSFFFFMVFLSAPVVCTNCCCCIDDDGGGGSADAAAVGSDGGGIVD